MALLALLTAGLAAVSPVTDGLHARAQAKPDPSQDPQEPAETVEVLFPLRTAWRADLAEQVVAPAGVDAGRAYVPLQSGALAALALTDGKVVWKARHPTRLTPVSNGKLVFAASKDAVEGISVASGDTRWRTPIPGAPAAAMVERAGWLIVPLASGDLLALRSADGKIVWRKALGAKAASQPAIDGERVYVPLDDARVVAADIFSGDVVWTRTLSGPVVGMFVYAELIYVSALDNFLYCLDDRSGEVDWRWRTGADLVGRADALGARVVFVSLDTVLRAHDWLNGAQRWRTPLPWRPHFGPQIVGTTVVMSGSPPEVRGYDLENGKEIGRLSFASSDVEKLQGPVIVVPPTRSGGTRLVAVSEEGKVYGLAPETPAVAKENQPAPR
ncbi:MAG: PQQ-binding-like beta-propeller repeat protein [Vicinamibacteraceae bacterium]